MTGVASFFDLDRTLLDAATEQVMAQQMRRAGLLGWGDILRIALAYLRYDNGITDYDALKRRSVRAVLADRPVAACSALAESLIESLMQERLFAEARGRLHFHRSAGHCVCIVSSAVDLLVAPCARHLEADAFFATALATDGECFSGEIHGRIHAGPAKAAAIREFAQARGLDLAASYAYGDHYDDRFMLASVGNPVAVNPNRRLRDHARQEGWQVVQWRV
jgi:HAD superfamily hydrolase (TIGR01490 family)